MTELLLFYRSGWFFFSLHFPPANPGSWRRRLKFPRAQLSCPDSRVTINKKKKKGHKIFVAGLADYTSSITLNFTQSSWQHILWLRPVQSLTATATHQQMLHDVCVPTGLSSRAANVWLFKRPIHPLACELDITIPITGLTRRVSAAHLPLRRLIRRFYVASAWHQPKVRTHLISLVAFVSPSLEMKWISHVGGETLAFYKCRARGKTWQSYFYCLMKRQNTALYGSKNKLHFVLGKQNMLVLVGITWTEMYNL